MHVIIELILAHDANPNLANVAGRRPLHLLCSNEALREGGVALEIAKILIGSRADPGAPAADGATPLHEACMVGDVAMCELLVTCGASVNAPLVQLPEGVVLNGIPGAGYDMASHSCRPIHRPIHEPILSPPICPPAGPTRPPTTDPSNHHY